MDPISIDDVIKASRFPWRGDQEKFIREAYKFAEVAHAGQLRRSGEPYITHCLHAAKILAETGMDATTIAAGLLHDVPEDTSVTIEAIEEKFGEEVAYLVRGITKLGKIRLRGSKEEYYLENLRRMFLAMAQDIRVVIVKLADRLHNMRTLQYVPAEKRERIARETFEIYSPIANRLGIGEIKSELEDLCFEYLDPEHCILTKKLQETYLAEGKTYIDETSQSIKKILEKERIKVLDIQGRTKNLYRLFKKLERHDMDITRIYDLIAIRIIVPEVADKGMKLESTELTMLGRATRVIATKDDTTIVGGKGKKAEIDERVTMLKTQASKAEGSYEREKLMKRMAKLSGGVAVIRVGAATETELTYMKHKMEDAVAATKAAIAEGIVAGGGTALVKAAVEASEKFKKEEGKVENDFKAGYMTVIKALEEPLRQIASNAGMSDASVVLNTVTGTKGVNAGYNAAKDSYENDMLKAGIIDPLKVTRTALENAVSVAALLLTTEAAVVDLPEEKKTPDMSGMGGGMGMPGMM